MLFGAANNYNTEQLEQLHINFTKNAYQATNFKEELKQMVTWLECYEAMHQRAAFMELHKGNSTLSTQLPVHYPFIQLRLHPFLTMHPSERQISFTGLASRFRAIDFQDTLADFIVQHNYLELSVNAARRRADNMLLPFQRVSAFHKIKFSTCKGQWQTRKLSMSYTSDQKHAIHVGPSTLVNLTQLL